jgi:pimeloyl-ACP methyl ester carboxylesterase
MVQNTDVAYGQTTLPQGIRSRFVDNNNGCRMHVLEAGFEAPGLPCVVLLHGFPELAYSWRKQLLPLARAGYHVVAPDLRGYGRSSGTEVAFEDDLSPFTLLNHVGDTLGLVRALGHEDVAAVVGHDYGSPVAAWCGVIRPDVFRSVVMMSAPFAGVPPLAGESVESIFDELAALPVPRKHYQRYYATPEANEDMWNAPGGIHHFLRAYYHVKSADWKQNEPFPLEARTADQLAKLPRYYVMDLGKGMPETVAPEMPSPEEVASCEWLTDEELSVYSGEYARTGFQGALQSYRVKWIEALTPELSLFSGRRLEVPSLFIAGERDWGAHLIPGAGHWVQQEQPEEVVRVLLLFI